MSAKITAFNTVLSVTRYFAWDSEYRHYVVIVDGQQSLHKFTLVMTAEEAEDLATALQFIARGLDQGGG